LQITSNVLEFRNSSNCILFTLPITFMCTEVKDVVWLFVAFVSNIT